MRLILVRHGAVRAERPRSFYGGSEVPLSADGLREAARAAAALSGRHLDHVACSPLSRARHGAERIADGRGLPGAPECFEGLREIHRGRWLGLTAEEVESRWPGDLRAHAEDPEAWRGHGGESLGDLRDRVCDARDALLRAWGGGTVAVVAHLYPIRALLAEALHRPLRDWESLNVPTGSVSVITGTALGWVVEAVGWQPEDGEELRRLPLGA
jgi:broad specificity phosphatase PhoE